MQSGDFAPAQIHLEIAAQLMPSEPQMHYGLGIVYAARGQWKSAAASFQRAVELKPDYAEALTGMARVLVTASDPVVRQPEKAVVLAEKACELTGRQQPLPLDALAAAYAGIGRFADAVAAAQIGIQRAQAAGNPQLATEMGQRLQLYQSGRAAP